MIVVKTVVDLHIQVARFRSQDKRIAFIPTMGNLHAGHLHLMQKAREHAEIVVASIYVNPLQFGEDEDFDIYPRTPREDRAALEAEGVDLLFMPGDMEIYPRGREVQTRVEVPSLNNILCGAFRPSHFRGVATVVNRLFNLVNPDVAVFGKKDYQQLLVIRLMVADLGMPVEIVGVETVREPDGLAMSSRNHYLSTEERKIAPRLYATLCTLRDQIAKHRKIFLDLENKTLQDLEAAGFRPEYVSIRRQQDLEIPQQRDHKLVMLAAAWLGRTRLIDNVELEIH